MADAPKAEDLVKEPAGANANPTEAEESPLDKPLVGGSYYNAHAVNEDHPDAGWVTSEESDAALKAAVAAEVKKSREKEEKAAKK